MPRHPREADRALDATAAAAAAADIWPDLAGLAAARRWIEWVAADRAPAEWVEEARDVADEIAAALGDDPPPDPADAP